MNRFQRGLLLWSSLLTALTGVVYWWMDTMLTPVNEWAVVNHPLQPWVLKAHIVVAPVLVFAIGLITMDHIWKHFRSAVQGGRRSGLTTMFVVVPMVVTGYLIQVTTHERWLTVVAWAHIATGLVYALGVLCHWWVVGRGRTKRRRRPSNADGTSSGKPARQRVQPFGTTETINGPTESPAGVPSTPSVP